MPKAQLEIPGTERLKIKAIEDAPETYVAIRDKRMKLTEQEVEAKASLIEVMLRHQDKLSLDSDSNYLYRYEDEVVILSEKAGVKVRHAVVDGEPEEE